uniref:FERM domain-containing protein n=1 Tax=Rhabditophanes sp. KR3021 TaxID=114890 RepID=A0AC35UAS3_9BILA
MDIYEEEKKLPDVKLLEKVMGELKKAKSRQTVYICLGWLAYWCDGGSVSFNEHKDGIFYEGVPKNVKGRLLSHIATTKLYFRRFIPFNDKGTRIMEILDNNRKIVASYCDELTANEALAFEYAITMDLQNVLTNIDAFEEKKLPDVKLLEKVMGELKKAKSRQTVYICLGWLAYWCDGGSVSFNEHKDGIFYEGVPKNVKGRLLSHIATTKLYFRRFIPFNDKETRIMEMLDNNRKIVASYCDELTPNEALAFEYAITMDLQNILTNIDAFGQSNDVMIKKHLETNKKISEWSSTKSTFFQRYF